MSDRMERVFGWVWRVNGLLLLALAGAGLLGAAALAISLAVDSGRARASDRVTQVAGTDIAASELDLGSFQTVLGTRLLYAPLGERYAKIRSGYGRGAARNLLFFDTATKRAHWLLPDNAATDAPEDEREKEKEAKLTKLLAELERVRGELEALKPAKKVSK